MDVVGVILQEIRNKAEEFDCVNRKGVVFVVVQERVNGLVLLEGQADKNGVGFLMEREDLEMNFIARAKGVGTIPFLEDVGIIGDTRLIGQSENAVERILLRLEDQGERCQLAQGHPKSS